MPRVGTCAACGDVMYRGPGSLPQGEATCRPCRRRQRCGSVNGYRKGCRCADCRSAHAAGFRAYAARRLAAGVNISHANRSSPTRSDWIRPDDRAAIYQRDAWVCQLCFTPVDSSLDPLHRDAATLDHIVPRSTVLFPDHTAANLRLAHRSCNSQRGSRT